MHVESRKDSKGQVTFRARVRRRGAPAISRTFATEAAASKWASATEAAIRDNRLPEHLTQDVGFGELIEAYGRLATPGKKGARQEQRRLVALARSKLARYNAANLSPGALREYRNELTGRGLSGSSVNRELSLVGAVMKWGRVERGVPVDEKLLRGLKLKENEARTRRLLPGELEKLLAAAGPRLGALITFAVETAMRRGEMAALTWADIDMVKRVATLKHTKNGERDARIPLSTRAIAALQSLPRGIGQASVFNLAADSVTWMFAKCCRAAGVRGLRLHDLRAEGVSRLFERGLALTEVKAISRHKSTAILRYARPNEAEALVERLG